MIKTTHVNEESMRSSPPTALQGYRSLFIYNQLQYRMLSWYRAYWGGRDWFAPVNYRVTAGHLWFQSGIDTPPHAIIHDLFRSLQAARGCVLRWFGMIRWPRIEGQRILGYLWSVCVRDGWQSKDNAPSPWWRFPHVDHICSRYSLIGILWLLHEAESYLRQLNFCWLATDKNADISL